MKVSIIIPTLNAEKYLKKSMPILKNYIDREYELLIIDSESEDNTVQIAQDNGAKVINVSRKNFNHGATRNIGIDNSKGDYLIYLTQDAIPFDKGFIDKILDPLIKNNQIGMSYGRQIPYSETSPFGYLARVINYGPESKMKSLEDVPNLGIKTVFCSNSFAAYNRKILNLVGNFPTNVILGEDTYVASKMILSGYMIYYNSEAKVYHSHNYTILEEFHRYFDTGVFHNREDWIIKRFSNAEGEGIKFVKTEMKYLISKKKIHLIFSSLCRNIMKYLGYKLGLNEDKLSNQLKIKLSMHKNFFS
ncbi:glycosyltransferase family 2 protein [Heyndrickxia coagulans]|uniref:glycosyltransferase family 2 protein n=1 Tax=Heyndrickxia coagulans TaxID=1398 RepID=UPI002E1B1388|nr:glycosyltransferase [Heyndrickxia coagulans]